MAVTRQQVENALKISIDDEALIDDNIKLQEMDAIKERFDGLFDTLRDEAEDADAEDEDEEEGTTDEP
jgi:hypothetical protein